METEIDTMYQNINNLHYNYALGFGGQAQNALKCRVITKHIIGITAFINITIFYATKNFLLGYGALKINIM